VSVILEFAMFPTDKGESVSTYVAPIIEMIRQSGADYQLTPMGTIIETDDLASVLALVQKAYDTLDTLDCNRVYSSLKLDIRKGATGRLKGKLNAIEAKIGTINI